MDDELVVMKKSRLQTTEAVGTSRLGSWVGGP